TRVFGSNQGSAEHAWNSCGMQIHDSFLVYTPTTEAPLSRPQALDRASWSTEMQAWLALHDPTQASFTPVPAPAEAPLPSSASVIANRSGQVLGAGRVLKSDQYPGLHRMNLNTGPHPQPRLTGAPNYREVNGENIHGVAQPTIEGIKGVLTQAGAGPDGSGKPAVWTSLREEPVVYVNGRPFNVRELAGWTRNIENPGATTEEVERSDAQLKADIQAELARNGNRILVHDESPDGKLVSHFEEVKPENVKTPREVFDGLKAEGYKVDYARIPITDEKAPDMADFTALVNRLKDVPSDQPVIFNCHAGRGRTTTAMVMAGLMQRAAKDVPGDEGIAKEPAVREDIKERANYRTGDYRVILSLIRTLERGPKSKQEADVIIDQYSGLQNLRESILDYKQKAETAPDVQQRVEARERGQQYLERYFKLIAFDAYAKEQAPTGYQKTFETWMKEHPALPRLLDNVQLAMGFNEKSNGTSAYA
ncbi:MAG: hypothetical protein EB084_23910, partial [Proteobacteria bacterium]|nr:hypothetical protein [Pseudomonadota bacterium]